MPHRRFSPFAVVFVGLLAASLLGGCPGSSRAVGEPCDTNSDCADGLICPPSTLHCTLPPMGSDARPMGADASFDAGPVCGDKSCDPTEACDTCPQDCGLCPTSCGDGTCNTTETCDSCPLDCGTCPPVCGDGSCDGPVEDCNTCVADCGTCMAVCGDGSCEAGEDCMSCDADCGACPPSCPDGTCDPVEDCSICPMDCGACPVCGNGVPEGTEECDLGAGNALNADCLPGCIASLCGDGNLNTAGPMGFEQCDPPGGACDATCQVSAAMCSMGIGGLVCGSVVTGANDMPGSTDVDTFYSCTGYTYGGPEVAYAFQSPVDTTVTFMLSGLTADLDLLILADSTCGPDSCVGGSTYGGTAPEVVSVAVTAGVPAYVIIEGYGGAISNFVLSAACEAPPPPATADCGSPHPISLPGPGSYTYFWDTCGTVNDTASPSVPDCFGAGNGEDVTFELDLGFNATVTLDMWDFESGPAIDTMVYVESMCGAGPTSPTPGVCNNDYGNEPRHAHLVTGLNAGIHYITADNLEYYVDPPGPNNAFWFTCGIVRLVVSAY